MIFGPSLIQYKHLSDLWNGIGTTHVKFNLYTILKVRSIKYAALTLHFVFNKYISTKWYLKSKYFQPQWDKSYSCGGEPRPGISQYFLVCLNVWVDSGEGGILRYIQMNIVMSAVHWLYIIYLSHLYFWWTFQFSFPLGGISHGEHCWRAWLEAHPGNDIDFCFCKHLLWCSKMLNCYSQATEQVAWAYLQTSGSLAQVRMWWRWW